MVLRFLRRDNTRPFVLGVSIVSVLMGVSCTSTSPSSQDAIPRLDDSSIAEVPLPGQSLRVGGDQNVSVVLRGSTFRVGACVVDTPLPDGYPNPTPPGAIDLKTYPAVRRAIVRGSGTPNRGMNSAFWPLFNHIKKHNIAMTSPVEMDYAASVDRTTEVPSSDWTMAFLYRTREQNATGKEQAVLVADAPPVTVVAVGVKGDYGTGMVVRGAEAIECWLATHPEWEPAGNWRSLYYNGPTLDFWNKWAEVQIPVRRRTAAGSPRQP
jgi:hypothetical protein